MLLLSLAFIHSVSQSVNMIDIGSERGGVLVNWSLRNRTVLNSLSVLTNVDHALRVTI